MTPFTRLTLPLAVLASLFVFTQPLLGQTPAERIEAIQREHADSLSDLCRAFDAELLRALPSWSDATLRWGLFGVPTDTERRLLSASAQELSNLLSAMQPIIEDRLREADTSNDINIEEAIQLSTVLMPLARARGLLLYGVAVDPAIGMSDESRRAFEEARRIALQAESVSAWSDAEQGLIIAASSLRLGQDEPAIDAIRRIREAMREQPLLTEQIAGIAPTRVALETLLVAVARSPADARESLPDDESDRERLRLRLAGIAAERSTTPSERDRLLRAEADRQASLALDMALGTDLQIDRERPAWIGFLQRSAALIDQQTAERLGGGAASAYALPKASSITTADGGAARVRRDLQTQDLSGLAVLGSILELRAGLMPAASPSDVPALVQAASELHLLAPGAIVTGDAMVQMAELLRATLRSGITAVSDDPQTQATTIDLIDTIIDRDDLGRSNLDLLAMSLLGSDQSLGRAQFVRDLAASELVTEALGWTGANDADAAWASARVGAALLDRIAREQLSDSIGEGVLDEAEEDRAIDAAHALAARMKGLGQADHEGLAASLTAIAAIRYGKPQEAIDLLRDSESAFVHGWINDMVSTRASLLASQPAAIASDGDRYGTAVFAHRDVPAPLSLRNALPEDQARWENAPSALIAGKSLSGFSPELPHLVVRCLSAALRTTDRETLVALRGATVEIAAGVQHSSDRVWIRLIGAEASMRMNDDAAAFAVLRDLVATTPVEDRSTRAYWHASMRMLEILARQNDDRSRTPAIAREIRRLKLQPSWGAHEDICDRIDAVAASIVSER